MQGFIQRHAANVIGVLSSHVQAKRLGKVLTRSGFILRRDPDTVRAADIAFIRAARIPPEGLPTEYWVGAPDLAVLPGSGVRLWRFRSAGADLLT